MLGEYSLAQVAFFVVLVIAALLVDLFAHKGDKVISMKNAAAWSIFWVAVSFLFAWYVGATHGVDHSSLFIAGYLLEKSLSVDNLFVMMAIFSSFAIKDEFQHRVLYYGILGALVLRMIFVAIGSSILLMFGKWALTVFGIFVIWSAWKMWQQSKKDHEEIEDYSHHWSVRLVQRIFPVYPKLSGHNFFVRHEGKLFCTPLFICLVVIEFADIMFAFDSVPAIIAITREPFLVYTSNIFAILGLRSMYFLLAGAKRYLCHLEAAVIAILLFIGIKMLLDVVGIIHITPTASLLVVVVLLSGGVIWSIVSPTEK